jgi:HEPN domain-containing protein
VTRAADWYQQAERDLEQAESSRGEGRHEWARHANSHAEGPPFEHFGALQSDEALRYAGEIIEFARPFVAGA